MKNTTNITPQMQCEFDAFMFIWGGHGQYTIIAPDESQSVIQSAGGLQNPTKIEKAKVAFMKIAKRGAVSIWNRDFDTGDYQFVPLFVQNEDSITAIMQLLDGFIVNNGPMKNENYIGTRVIEYKDRYCVLVKLKIQNIASAQRMISAFVNWVAEQINAEVETSDRVPLCGKFLQSKRDIFSYCEGLSIFEISEVADIWFDDTEKPLPPMWISEINMTRKPDTTDIFASVGNTPIVQRGGITLISGAAKSGKTLLVSSIIASCVGKDTILGIAPGTPARILWCDTEQSENDLATVRERIEGMAGVLLKNADIKGLRLRPFGPEKSTEIIENALKQYQPDILLVDGPGDLCTDTNDIAASQATVKTLLRWCDEYDCAIVGVVHTNPGSEKTRGHIGSEIERKCAFSLLTAKNDALDSEYPTFKVKPGFMRGKSFKTYSFRYNENGLPELIDNIDPAKMNSEDVLLGELETGFSYSYSQLLQKASEIDITEGTAKSAISRLIRKGKLEKSESGYTVIGG